MVITGRKITLYLVSSQSTKGLLFFPKDGSGPTRDRDLALRFKSIFDAFNHAAALNRDHYADRSWTITKIRVVPC